MDFAKTLAAEFKLAPERVAAAIALIDEGNTIPFIARYRKEATGSMDDQVLRELNDRLAYLRNLQQRKAEVAASITEQEKMTDEIRAALDAALTLAAVEDIYRPFKPKRRTRATMAREKGLEPLAEILWAQEVQSGSPDELAKPFIDPEKGVDNAADALQGAMDIIAENTSDNAELRKNLRGFLMREGILTSKAAIKEDSVYRLYYDFLEPLQKIPNHRVLAINRGEREGCLNVSLSCPEGLAFGIIEKANCRRPSVTTPLVQQAGEDAWKRLIFPSLENEVRGILKERADTQAISTFALNLRGLLMQPPVKGKTVLGFDPAYRTGCKLAAVDGTGKVLLTDVIYPTPPQNKVEEAKAAIQKIVSRYGVQAIAIGNGTASKESEIFIAGLIKDLPGLQYIMVNEAGASVYSASKLAAEEFPEYDVSLRSAVSIARRLQDPLAELVKIDPKSIGVGQYQHDMPPKELHSALGGVVEDCVNAVGVDVNTASASLLSYVAGLSGAVAKNIVAYREENGPFAGRYVLKKVPKLGPKAFEQCAGFLRIADGTEPLDATSVHPESYAAAKQLVQKLGFAVTDVKGGLTGISLLVKDKGRLAAELDVGEATLGDIVKELEKPGRDPRDDMPQPILRTDVLEMEDLTPGMTLMGTVRNVIDFGAFVDIGVHQDGLVHISKLTDKKFVKHPLEVVSVGDVIEVEVLGVDLAKKRIQLKRIEAR